MRVVENGRVRARAFLDLRRAVRSGGEQGLLSIAFDAGGRHLYALYTNRAGDSRVVRYPARGRSALRQGARVLLAVDQPYENHNGGTVLFDVRGRLLVGLGDGGSAFDPGERAQDRRSRLGKILRREIARPAAGWEIVALGLRNPWRMALDAPTGTLWIGDVGQDRVEEVDAVALPEGSEPALNLGWPAYEGSEPVGRKRLADGPAPRWPLAGYRHRDGHCSVTGGLVYRGSDVPALRGRYVFADFCRGTTWTLDARGAIDRRALDLRRERARLPGVTSFGNDLRGELYAVTVEGALRQAIPDNSGLD